MPLAPLETWLQNALQESLGPESPWEKLQTQITHNLAQRIESVFGNEDRKQELSRVVGKTFCKLYFPKHHLKHSRKASNVRFFVTIYKCRILNSKLLPSGQVERSETVHTTSVHEDGWTNGLFTVFGWSLEQPQKTGVAKFSIRNSFIA